MVASTGAPAATRGRHKKALGVAQRSARSARACRSVTFIRSLPFTEGLSLIYVQTGHFCDEIHKRSF